MSVKPTNIPQCHLRQSADSAGNFSRHGKLGELTENIRTFALPYDAQTYTFKMIFRYDSWNRIDSMTYPDGEVVSYGYNRGGMLENIRGNKNGDLRTYVKDIRYNKFELKESEKYGNGTWMSYEYDSLLRLSHLYSWDGNGDTMQSIGYTYDYVGNITDIANSAVTLPNGLGGSYYSHYDYDPLYRLTGAYGDWNNNQLSYNLGMQYYGNGKIWSKQLYADVLDQGNVTVRNYNNRYYYGSSTSNTVTSVYDQTNHGWQSFSWDMAGNMVYHQDANGCGRTLCWDEENRLMSFADCENAGFYQYDAGGERTYKLTSDYVSQNIGGHWHTYQVLDNPTLYTSPYMVATPKGYTKHYYAESERIASKLGNGGLQELGHPLADDIQVHDKLFANKNHAQSVIYECLNAEEVRAFSPLSYLYELTSSSQSPEDKRYFYHPDHLGSSSWITFTDGEAVQHLHYLPYGEDLVNQQHTVVGAMYTFSAKEKDAETGYSYFGSRYYNSELSIWLSVDPQSDKYPSFSPYVYCANNPIKLVDPNGEDIISVDQKTGETTITKQEGKDILRCGKNEITLSGNGVFGKAYNGVVKEGTLLVGMTKKDSRDVFNFMADNTNVEWGYLEIQNEDGSSSFMVGSANDSDGESQVYNMAMAAKSGSVLRYDHSHPKTNNPGLLDWAPSTPNTATDKEKVDTKAWSNLLERNPNASFGIRYGGETQTFIDGGVVTGAYPLINKYMN